MCVLISSFFDPLWTSEGKLYAPERLKSIAYERYIITCNCNTSYSDTVDITPTERTYLLEFITNDLKKKKESIEKLNTNKRK
uniref:Uncharacterized protein n=1 Tax=Siphoviridae sp. ctiOl67 TaxID=2825622 RepID=A0A8S5QKI0_9CAUD|nr:MAG TPA: hypothetical protein [Siphoviridae sp. ctiOl67]